MEWNTYECFKSMDSATKNKKIAFHISLLFNWILSAVFQENNCNGILFEKHIFKTKYESKTLFVYHAKLNWNDELSLLSVLHIEEELLFETEDKFLRFYRFKNSCLNSIIFSFGLP